MGNFKAKISCYKILYTVEHDRIRILDPHPVFSEVGSGSASKRSGSATLVLTTGASAQEKESLHFCESSFVDPIVFFGSTEIQNKIKYYIFSTNCITKKDV
jgi:hypothetical protein